VVPGSREIRLNIWTGINAPSALGLLAFNIDYLNSLTNGRRYTWIGPGRPVRNVVPFDAQLISMNNSKQSEKEIEREVPFSWSKVFRKSLSGVVPALEHDFCFHIEGFAPFIALWSSCSPICGPSSLGYPSRTRPPDFSVDREDNGAWRARE